MDEYHLLAAYDDSGQGVIIVLEDHTITYANAAAADLLGTSREEAVGQKCCMLLGLSGICSGPNCPVWSAMHKAEVSRHKVSAVGKGGERVGLDVRSVLYRSDGTISSALLHIQHDLERG